MQTFTLETPDVDLVYDVYGDLPPEGARPPLVMIGQPMCAEGFTALASYLPDRTVVAYDVRGLGRSVRKDGRQDHTPRDNADDVHAIIEAIGGGPVDLLGSSGGAVTALELVTRYPGDVNVAVAHEPPVLGVLPDAELARRAEAAVQARYREAGFGAGMAEFAKLTSWQGEYTREYFEQPVADAAQMGLPIEDDGDRGNPLLSGDSAAVTAYEPELAALAASPTRLVVAVGEESARQLPGRAGSALAAQLGGQATLFPSHHGGFMGGELGYAGKPEEFAAKLREVLEG
jgi:pimeloyl-ACP methyl ester carboxylesterase